MDHLGHRNLRIPVKPQWLASQTASQAVVAPAAGFGVARGNTGKAINAQALATAHTIGHEWRASLRRRR